MRRETEQTFFSHANIYLFFIDAKATYASRPTSTPDPPAKLESWNVLLAPTAPAPLQPLPRTISTMK